MPDLDVLVDQKFSFVVVWLLPHEYCCLISPAVLERLMLCSVISYSLRSFRSPLVLCPLSCVRHLCALLGVRSSLSLGLSPPLSLVQLVKTMVFWSFVSCVVYAVVVVISVFL